MSDNFSNFCYFAFGVCITFFIIGTSFAASDSIVTIKTDAFTNTKYIIHQNTIYTLTPYKKIPKE